jgi:SAM-dependent methyltransferase
MKKIVKIILQMGGLLGFFPVVLYRNLTGIPFYLRDYLRLRKQPGVGTLFPFGRPFPILNERRCASGVMQGHYFHQDLLVARKIFLANPTRHVDIGSRTDGFVAHVASFRKIEVLDIRPQNSRVANIEFKQADLMNLPAGMVDYTDSLSSLHAIEHFGLGRYGDPVDSMGHVRALDNIHAILKKGGAFYFAVPIGRQRIEFNAHRVFDVSYLIGLLGDRFTLRNFSYVDDKGDLHENVELSPEGLRNNFGCRFGCGIFEWIKN